MPPSAPRLRDTIVAPSSAAGAAPLGIVRLSGAEAFAIAGALAGRVPRGRGVAEVELDLSAASSRVAARLWLFPGPRSATGEDVAEIHALGLPPLLAEIVRECVRRGARLAAPGEFTRRAFLAGRVDLLEAEAVADLVAAETAGEAARAAPALRGELGRRVERAKETLLDAAARVEAWLDFPDDDVPAVDWNEIAAAVDAALAETATWLGGRSALRVAGADEPIVALVGEPNAGKSTLFNALAGAERAIVSDVAGTTRDAVDAVVWAGGRRVRLVDTAGAWAGGAAPSDVDAAAAERAEAARRDASLVLLVADRSRPPGGEARPTLRDRPIEAGRALVVGTKSDLAPDPRALALLEEAAARRHPGLAAFAVAAGGGGAGVDALLSAIGAALDAIDRRAVTGAGAPPGTLVAARQRAALRDARRALRRARVHVRRRSGATGELLAADLRDASTALGTLTGSTPTPDALLDRIFSRFCIGK